MKIKKSFFKIMIGIVLVIASAVGTYAAINYAVRIDEYYNSTAENVNVIIDDNDGNATNDFYYDERTITIASSATGYYVNSSGFLVSNIGETNEMYDFVMIANSNNDVGYVLYSGSEATENIVVTGNISSFTNGKLLSDSLIATASDTYILKFTNNTSNSIDLNVKLLSLINETDPNNSSVSLELNKYINDSYDLELLVHNYSHNLNDDNKNTHYNLYFLSDVYINDTLYLNFACNINLLHADVYIGAEFGIDHPYKGIFYVDTIDGEFIDDDGDAGNITYPLHIYTPNCYYYTNITFAAGTVDDLSATNVDFAADSITETHPYTSALLEKALSYSSNLMGDSNVMGLSMKVTHAATLAATTTLNLYGDEYTVDFLTSDDTNEEVASKIAAIAYDGWLVTVNNDTITFISTTSGAKSGTVTFTANGTEVSLAYEESLHGTAITNGSLDFADQYYNYGVTFDYVSSNTGIVANNGAINAVRSTNSNASVVISATYGDITLSRIKTIRVVGTTDDALFEQSVLNTKNYIENSYINGCMNKPVELPSVDEYGITLNYDTSSANLILNSYDKINLQITTGATSAGNLTISLRGTNYIVSLTASDDTPLEVANTISSALYSGWTVTSNGIDTVTFINNTEGLISTNPNSLTNTTCEGVNGTFTSYVKYILNNKTIVGGGNGSASGALTISGETSLGTLYTIGNGKAQTVEVKTESMSTIELGEYITSVFPTPYFNNASSINELLTPSDYDEFIVSTSGVDVEYSVVDFSKTDYLHATPNTTYSSDFYINTSRYEISAIANPVTENEICLKTVLSFDETVITLYIPMIIPTAGTGGELGIQALARDFEVFFQNINDSISSSGYQTGTYGDYVAIIRIRDYNSGSQVYSTNVTLFSGAPIVEVAYTSGNGYQIIINSTNIPVESTTIEASIFIYEGLYEDALAEYNSTGLGWVEQNLYTFTIPGVYQKGTGTNTTCAYISVDIYDYINALYGATYSSSTEEKINYILAREVDEVVTSLDLTNDIVTLVVTNPVGDIAGNVAITLPGLAPVNVSLTLAYDTEVEVATAIAAASYTGWSATADGSCVIFVNTSGPQTGTASFTDTDSTGVTVDITDVSVTASSPSIVGISYLSKTSGLVLDGLAITSLQPLANSNFASLSMKDCTISATSTTDEVLDYIYSMRFLTHLYLDNEDVSSSNDNLFTKLTYNSNSYFYRTITNLTMSNVGLNNIDGISLCPSITQIDIRNNNIRVFEELKALENLQTVSLYGNVISNDALTTLPEDVVYGTEGSINQACYEALYSQNVVVQVSSTETIADRYETTPDLVDASAILNSIYYGNIFYDATGYDMPSLPATIKSGVSNISISLYAIDDDLLASSSMTYSTYTSGVIALTAGEVLAAGNIQIILNSTTYTIPLLAADVVSANAAADAVAAYFSSNPNWTVSASYGKLSYISKSTGVKPGTFSYTDVGTTGIAGAISVANKYYFDASADFSVIASIVYGSVTAYKEFYFVKG